MRTSTDDPSSSEPLEDLDAYRERFRAWADANLPRRDPVNPWRSIEDDDDRATRNRELMQLLHSGGFSGICYPKEYGGQGLPVAYQRAVDSVIGGYDYPALFSIPTFSITGPTVLEFGTEEQKRRYIPKWISGEELWVQFMSEPSGGSDMAGALTRADRDGDTFVINGSKVWSTFAYRSDYALLLARTNWDVPKHRGLTMFIVPVHHPGIEVTQIKMIDGSEEFCQEFFTDAVIPAENVLGEVDDGWTVATRLLFHERAAVSASSPYTFGGLGHRGQSGRSGMIDLALANGWAGDARGRQMIGRVEELAVIQDQLVNRIAVGLSTGYFDGPAGSMARLLGGMSEVELTTMAMELQRDPALVWDDGALTGRRGIDFVRRQGSCLGGGSVEMARNLISERILGMPREAAADRGVPFRDVPRNG